MLFSDSAVLRVLSNQAGPISLMTIAGKTRYTKRTVIKSVKRLETLGYVQVNRACRPHRYEVTNDGVAA